MSGWLESCKQYFLNIRLGVGVFDNLHGYQTREVASRLVLITNFWGPLQTPSFFPLGNHLEIKGPDESSLFCMDCCFGWNLDSWQLKVEEGKDYRLVLYVQMQWWICWSPFATLLYCFRLMVHDIWFVWRVVELLACWQGQFGNHRNSHIWIVIPHCLMGCFWREKNSRSFEDTESSMPDLKLFFFRTLLDWLSAMRNLSLFSIVDLLDLCNFCKW